MGFRKTVKDSVLYEQDHRCNFCNKKFSQYCLPQFDHIDGIKQHNYAKNCQALCANCHDIKSRKQNSKRKPKKQIRNVLDNPLGEPFDF